MKVKNEPKITVNKLGEYLVASSTRQRKILETIKYPKDEGGQWGFVHSDAREALKRYFVSGFDDSHIVECINKLKDSIGTDSEKNYYQSSILLLEKALDSRSEELKSFEFELYSPKKEYLNIEGVSVSVYPDLLVKSHNRGKDYVGALKIHLTKNSELNQESGKFIATILHKYTTEFFLTDLHIKTDLHISYDVISDNIIKCPLSVKNRWKEIEAGCKNIAAIWKTI